MKDELLERLRLAEDGADLASGVYLVLTSYKAAVDACRQRDPFGIVTYRAIARERRIDHEVVRRYFGARRKLKVAWRVMNEHEAKAERCRMAATRFREREPDKALTRKRLAFELGWLKETLTTYLRQHPQVAKDVCVAGRVRAKEKAKKERVDLFDSYKSSAEACRRSDWDDLATYEGIAKDRKIGIGRVASLFHDRRDLKVAWGVLNVAESKEARCLLTAARIRRRHPKKPLLRLSLAFELR